MRKKLLKVNKLIDIEIERETEPGELVTEAFASRIEDIKNDSLYLAYPLKNGYPVHVRNNELINLKIIYKNDVYSAKVKALASLSSPILLLRTTKPEHFVRIQLRNWVRHPCHTLVDFKIINDSDDKDKEIPLNQEYSIDISGGGMLLHTKQAMDVNTPLHVEFSLEDYPITANARVVRCITADDKFRTAIEFTEIKEREREEIIRYIFQKQREILRKKLL